MNKKQKVIFWIAFTAFILITLFPPNKSIRGPLEPIFLLSYKTIVYSKLVIYWVLIAVPSVALFYYFKDKNEKDKKPKDG